MTEDYQPEEKSFSQEVRHLILENAASFLYWMKPAKADPFWLMSIKLVLKLPVFLLVLLLSPIAFIVLVITFIVVF
jgi:hypothetical protein